MQKHPITVPKTQEALREAHTNLDKGIEVKIASEKISNKGLGACSPLNP